MTERNLRHSTCLALAVVFTIACTSKSVDETIETPPQETGTEMEIATAETPTDKATPSAVSSELAGTSWQLVEIQSMDDTVLRPEDATPYTLEFGADGSMSVVADCNRGTGSWSSESPGQLEFGVIAATQAACPPGSIHDQYMAQFEWVRSYVLEDGHLYLATMADGSIIEFAPAE